MVRASASEGVNMYLILWGQAQMQGKESELWGRGCQLINYLKITAEEVWALEKRLEFRERIVQQESEVGLSSTEGSSLCLAHTCLLLHGQRYYAFVLFSSVF